MSAPSGELPEIDKLELDVSPHDAQWFQSLLIDCITGLDEAETDQERARIQGRLFVLRDLFNLSEIQVVRLARRFGVGDEMATLLEVDE